MRQAGGVRAPVLQARHQPSGLNSSFTAQPAFPEYIAHSREMIFKARSTCGQPVSGQVVEGNAPFELWPDQQYRRAASKSYRRGILLTHGLSDSPYFMRHLANFFREQGFAVKAVLLPGHGTRPGDLLEVGWQEWFKAVNYGAEQLAAEVEQLYLGGYSAGGALSVYHALQDKRVQGLFLFAPALKISAKAAWANLHKCYSWLLPRAKWLSIKPDADCYKYESFAKNTAAQMHRLTQAVAAQLINHPLCVPVFTVQSQDDATVDAQATINLMQLATHPANKLIYYFSDAAKIPSGLKHGQLECLDCVLPDEHILSSAHTAIVLPREDEYYGERGVYCNCLHYYPHEMAKYRSCNDFRNGLMQGELNPKNLARGDLRRLMYNPHYADMQNSMQQFIAKLPD